MPEANAHDTLAHYGPALVSERMLMVPSEIERRVEMFRLNGGKPIDLPRRTLADCAGAMALGMGMTDAPAAEEPFMRLGRTAVISIDGPITFAASFLSWLFGGLSVPEITRALYAAKADPDIDRVLLDFDCPGGQIAGVSDMLEAIDSVAAAMPVISYAHDTCASLAVWLASHTHRVVASPSSGFGSIGAIAMTYDTSKLYEKEGLRAVVFTEAKSKATGYGGVPIDDEMIEAEMRVIRSMGQRFRADVSTKTGISGDELLGMQGAMHYAPEALELGLIDEIMPVGAFYAAVDRGEFDRYGPGNEDTNTTTSGENQAAQTGVHTMSAKLKKIMAGLSDEDRRALAAMASEDEQEAMDDEDQEAMDEDEQEAEDEDDDEESAEDSDEDEQAEDDEEEEPSAKRGGGKSGLALKKAKAVLADFELPKAMVNELAIECVEQGWNEATLTRKAFKKSRQAGAAAVVEHEAAGDAAAIGGARASKAVVTGGANAKIDSMAKAMCAANPNMTHAAARARVIKENQALRDQYCAEVNDARAKIAG